MIKIMYKYEECCFGCGNKVETYSSEVKKHNCPKCFYLMEVNQCDGIKTVIEDDCIEEMEVVPEPEEEQVMNRTSTEEVNVKIEWSGWDNDAI